MFLPVIFFAALASAFYIGLQRSDDTSLPSVLIGQLAPNISKEELYPGSEVTPEILQSPNIKLVNFWASWCPPCRAEHSKLLEIADSGTVIVGVNIKDDKKTPCRICKIIIIHFEQSLMTLMEGRQSIGV